MREKKDILKRAAVLLLACTLCLCGCGSKGPSPKNTDSGKKEESVQPEPVKEENKDKESAGAETAKPEQEKEEKQENVKEPSGENAPEEGSFAEEESEASSVVPAEEAPPAASDHEVAFDPAWEYAGYSAIHTGNAMFRAAPADRQKGITVCINAGHGTSGGSSVKTQCHPDGTPKVTGGTTQEGATEAVAVSTGCDLQDGTSEASANLALALIVRDRLLAEGYNVLMIRETDDVQLDNIARTVIANNNADCHIALHYDSTETDKGVFFMSVPSAEVYRSMEPVASHWQQHNALGEAVVQGIASQGFALYGNGAMEMDLTQTSYSTVPSIDLEVGDKVSDHSEAAHIRLAEGIAAGVNAYFGQ